MMPAALAFSHGEKWFFIKKTGNFYQKKGDFFFALLYNPATHRYCRPDYRSYFDIEGREYQRLEGVMTGLLDSVGALLGVPLKFKF